MAFSVVEQPKSPNPFARVLRLRRAANAGQGGDCEDDTRLEAAGLEAVVSQHFLPCLHGSCQRTFRSHQQQ